MSRCTIRCSLIFFATLLSVSCAAPFANNDYENVPKELSRELVGPRSDDEIQPRLLPFSTSFSVGLGPNRGHSLGISGTKDGISLSQSSSLGGNGPLAGSKSNSFSAGLSGIAASDASAYNLFGKSKTNSNAFSLGDANASSQADVKDGKVSSGAQSAVGNEYNKASSGASSNAGNGQATANADASAVQTDHQSNRPQIGFLNNNRNHGSQLGFNVHKYHQHEPNQWHDGNSDAHIAKGRPSREHPWRNTNLAPEGPWSSPYPIDGHQHQNHFPTGTRVSSASASSSSSSSGNGFAFGHSSSQSSNGPNGPTSKTNNHVYSSGNAQSQAQGVAASVQEDSSGQAHGSFSSGNIAASSQGHGHSSGTAVSENRGEHSVGDVKTSSHGTGLATGNADAAAVSFNGSPEYNRGHLDDSVIPSEFLRSGLDSEVKETPVPTGADESRPGKKGPIRKILSDINSAVTGLFHRH